MNTATVSNFILTSALTHAEKTIHEYEVMSLNNRDSEVFFNALVKSVRFNKKLADAFEEHNQRVINK
ncbi:DUF1778 domain-containing protein [Photorhabdus laumondii subsp. laumondii]|uniref:Photorhabdus luminescens subsp. laumondii TTO1 complete genome segment 8/17 n=3 Tax=Photorhabdus TaxID=29487 RepID=Q7N4P0_PHOLL|nr:MULTISPECIES: DUF1778 domain-containing protein [Photorhabdus]AWK42055.1 hypothetical protein A4R40_11435 [Photorhabdus laumondii subsp. laumondii]AXG42918.1 DUF1778 domain-containing protein [Photorhabdus laumondii subsp. laumondii]AXG47379.1 DUF1778 domain-containing protein [Photorhabdus laumondii subsp. laumondii]KTL63196.1 hypothetical protein AA106_04390 [Photorhabdus laumondii subsp. laumondii]MCC8384500.1 DUF1778 domain-containing protein [Photorhabdus laumondii]